MHVKRTHPDLSLADWEKLPEIANTFDEVFLSAETGSNGEKRLLFVKRSGENQAFAYVGEFAQGRRKGERLNVVTFFKDHINSILSHLEEVAVNQEWVASFAAGGKASFPGISPRDRASNPPDSQPTPAPGEGQAKTPRFMMAGSGTANHKPGPLFEAMQMERSGKTRKQIWEATGWTRDVDGEWRFEIDDSRADIGWEDRIVKMETEQASVSLPSYSKAVQPEFETTQPELELYVPTKEEARRDPAGAARLSVRAHLRSGTVLGNAIARDFQEQGHVSLIGQQVRNSEDLAVLAQVYRNPAFKTMRYFFMKGDVVVGQTGVSSRLPGVIKSASG